MEKVIRNGKVAVLISHGFGAGWYSWNLDHKEILFHPKLVEMVEQDKMGGITEEWVKENLGLEGVYCGGAEELQIVWLPVGTAFTIEEYNGAESIINIEDLVIIA
jgi:hypothetical protein